jgi:plastocyanin
MSLPRPSRTLLRWACALLCCSSLLLVAQEVTVTGQVDLRNEGPAQSKKNRANVVIWLTALDDAAGLRSISQEAPGRPPRLVQKNKKFEPHVLVVPAGTAVEFPNHDPFFHNVFSLFEGKRFDLGLYEAGTSRFVRFDRVGVSYIFCNIHPEMSAVVVALKTPYYGISDAAGKIAIAHVPEGRYSVQVWAEGASVENLNSLKREAVIAGTEHSLGVVHIMEDSPPGPHKNKYGRDYDAPGTDYPPTDPK